MYYQFQIRFSKKTGKAEYLESLCNKLEERFANDGAEFNIIEKAGIVSNGFLLSPWGSVEHWWDNFFDCDNSYDITMINSNYDVFSWIIKNGKCMDCSKIEVVSCEPEIVTVEKALNWLKKTPENELYRNRDVIDSHVKELCEKMKAGLWKDTADPIEVLSSGELVNGQHRLNAVVMADMSVSMNVRTYRKCSDLFF